MAFGRYIQNTIIEFACIFQFSRRFAFINFSSFKSDTGNNANYDAVSNKRANLDKV